MLVDIRQYFLDTIPLFSQPLFVLCYVSSDRTIDAGETIVLELVKQADPHFQQLSEQEGR